MKLKILLLNFGYGLGLRGSFLDLLTKGYRYLFCPEAVQRQSMTQLNQLIQEQKPNLSCIIEIRRDQVYHLTDRHITFRNKYGPLSLLSSLPVTGQNGNAVASGRPLKVTTRYLKCGLKKLVYEIELNDTHVFVVHLALLRSSIRKQQIEKLKKLIAPHGKVIVCGDFNVKNWDDLSPLLDKLKVANSKKENTFPSHSPRRTIDLFLFTPNLAVSKCQVLTRDLSDHLPVVLEFDNFLFT